MQTYIDKWGAAAVLGGPLSLREITDILAAEYIVWAYNDRQKAASYVEWTSENTDAAGMLALARELYGNDS